MRLTLRTMLAYLDDILEPADRDEIGRKIEESDFAKQLVNRIRESTHKMRLGAPKLSGKGPGMDPNTVAEYLDNTLAGERVPDFEKVCLESDTHLAEVAASHQILTLVLGQPVDVDPAMKRRVYGLVLSSEMPRAIEPVGERFAPGYDEGLIPGRQRVEVPDYLRDRPGHSRWRTIVAALALVLLLCGAITMALGPLDRTNPVARWLGFGQQPENQLAQNKAGEAQPAPATASQPEKSSTSTSPESSATPATSSETTAGTGEKPQSPETTVASSQPSSAAPPDESMAKESTAKPPATATASDSEAAAPSPGGTPAATESGPSAGSSMPAETATAPPVPADPGRSSPLPPQTEPPAAGSVPPPAQPAEILLGRLLPGKGSFLLKLDPTAGQWNRLAASSPLSAGDQLLVLPTFRPTLALSSGITLQVPSETLIELLPPDANGVSGVRLHFGRLVVMTTGQSGAKLRLDLGVAGGLVLFTDSEATLAAEVRRFHPPGVDPEAQDAHVAADLYAVSGRVQWTPSDGATATLTAPQRVVLAAHPSDPANADAGKPIPKWIASEQLIPLNALAADDLVKTISDDKRPIILELQEMADSSNPRGRRIECRSLAVQCLALLDQFEPLITALGDADERSVWPVHIASVRSALARGPSTAAKVRETFQKQRGDGDGRELYRMLWGYTRDQLQGGDAVKLVAFLGNDNLDMRVLAFADLQDICHLTFNYRPDAQPASREGPIGRWQEQQRKGLIVPK